MGHVGNNRASISKPIDHWIEVADEAVNWYKTEMNMKNYILFKYTKKESGRTKIKEYAIRNRCKSVFMIITMVEIKHFRKFFLIHMTKFSY